MNHVFKVVFCKITGTMKAAPEFAKGAKKSSVSTSTASAKSVVAGSLMLASMAVVAAPPITGADTDPATVGQLKSVNEDVIANTNNINATNARVNAANSAISANTDAINSTNGRIDSMDAQLTTTNDRITTETTRLDGVIAANKADADSKIDATNQTIQNNL
ncbi:ESPR-type extended signal peptide-containing protein, partial [Psychrobacter celer]|uniref:ESPR-type extended signal peptide-containing protein n=1 Tax=Psychrobacter celer TaxID=306572 RepID=UPI003FD5719C